MNENLYIAHKKNFHSKTLRVHSARYTQCIHVSSRKLKLPKDTHTKRYKQLLPTHPFPKVELYCIAVKCKNICRVTNNDNRRKKERKKKKWGRSTYSSFPLLELPSLVTSDLSFTSFSPNGGRSLAGRCSSSIWYIYVSCCCSWNGQVETDVLSRLSRMAMLTHNYPFEIRFWRSF